MKPIAWKYLWHAPLNTVLHILVIGLGTGLLALLLLAGQGLSGSIERQSKIADLVVGAKGSPLQLVLCVLFHADLPTGNIALADADVLAGSPLVAAAVPLAIGDSHRGFRVVGTSPSFFKLYGIEGTAQGELSLADGHALAGYEVAQQLGLSLGYRFHSEHGLDDGGDAHDAHGYELAGILPPTGTPADRLLLVSIPSVWEAHHADSLGGELGKLGLPMAPDAAITAVLLKFNNPMGSIRFLPYINQQTNMQAASPSFETYRLLELVGGALEVGRWLVLLIMAVAFLSMGLSLYHALQERRYDLAIMRAMGASRLKIASFMLFEGGAQTLMGSTLGVAGAMAAWWLLARHFHLDQQTAATAPYLAILLGSTLALGLLASAIPAWQAYRTSVSETLSKG